MRLVVGQISYLNSQPFYPLLLGEHRLIPTPPSELGRMASRGEIDAGVLATAGYLVDAERAGPVGGREAGGGRFSGHRNRGLDPERGAGPRVSPSMRSRVQAVVLAGTPLRLRA